MDNSSQASGCDTGDRSAVDAVDRISKHFGKNKVGSHMGVVKLEINDLPSLSPA